MLNTPSWSRSKSTRICSVRIAAAKSLSYSMIGGDVSGVIVGFRDMKSWRNQMNNSEVPMFLQHKLDQWETSIDTFIRLQSDDELNNYMERLVRKFRDDNTSAEDALITMLALFGLTYVWMNVMKRDNSNSEGQTIDD
jgi:hypothetical protein